RAVCPQAGDDVEPLGLDQPDQTVDHCGVLDRAGAMHQGAGGGVRDLTAERGVLDPGKGLGGSRVERRRPPESSPSARASARRAVCSGHSYSVTDRREGDLMSQVEVRKGQRRAILLSVSAAVGGFLFGFDSSVINGAVDAIETDFELSPTATGFAVAVALLP